MRTLALVPARSGSKGIPGKNTRMLWGRPLISWAVQVGVRTCNRTYVTTDDPTIGLVSSQCGAGVIMRPKDLASDTAPMLDVVQHALESLAGTFEPDVIVLLQPTQPLRTVEHVRTALEMLPGADSVVSVVEVPAHYSPDYVMRVAGGWLWKYQPGEATRRQDAGKVYSRDGTVYAVRAEVVRDGSLYGTSCRPLIVKHSESVNLDTEDDWRRAEMMETRAYA